MDSFAFLYKLRCENSNNPQDLAVAEIHVNYWKISPSNKNNRYLDIGIMVKKVGRDIDQIFVYLPFNIESNKLQDIGGLLKDSDFLCTLFNCECTIQNLPEQKNYHLVTLDDKNRSKFYLYELSSHNFETEQLQKGTLVKIRILSYPSRYGVITENEGENLYVRFRINVDSKNSFTTNDDLSNDFIQSVFSKVEIVDFHINDYRSIDRRDSEILPQNNRYYFQLGKVHFYFVGTIDDEDVSGTIPADQRLMPQDRWDGYIKNIEKSSKDTFLAYHWSRKSEKPFKKYNLYFKVTYQCISYRKVIKYILVLFLINILSGVFLNFIFNNNHTDSKKNKEIEYIEPSPNTQNHNMAIKK